MGYSFYEIYTTSQRAFRGMGFPFGADEDAAYIIAWLELNNFNGVKIFKNIIKKIDQKYDGKFNNLNIHKTIDFKNKSILMKGSGLIDYLQSLIHKDQKIIVNIKNCTYGILFLPLIYKAHRNIKFLELIFKDLDNKIRILKIYNNKIFFYTEENKISENEIQIIFSNNKLDITNDLSKELISEKIIQENLLRSLNPIEDHWKTISNIANRTFVPESDESRNRGAGGGDAND